MSHVSAFLDTCPPVYGISVPIHGIFIFSINSFFPEVHFKPWTFVLTLVKHFLTVKSSEE